MAKKVTKASWYQTGKTGATKAKKIDAENKKKREQGGSEIMRFWLESDSSAMVTFLDTPSFFYYEHNLKLGGKYFNFFTCLQDFDTCPLCEDDQQSRASYVLAGTVISHKKFTDKDGKTHTNQKQLFVAKGRARQRLLKQIERREGNLKGCVFEMSRGTGQTESSVGEDFEFVKRLDAKTLLKFAQGDSVEKKKEWLKPFDYPTLLAPKSAEELRKIIGQADPIGSSAEDDNVGDEPDDDVLDNGGDQPDDDDDLFEDDVASIEDLI